MADSERIQHLKTARTEMVEKRIFLIGRLIEDDAANDANVFSIIEASLLNTQALIDVIDKALADERLFVGR